MTVSVPFFAAVVSCTTAANAVITTTNVTTANFAATIPGGNARIDQKLMLPRPCVAPVVMVTAPAGTPTSAGGRQRSPVDFARPAPYRG